MADQFCGNCGNPFSKDDKYCCKCGQKLKIDKNINKNSSPKKPLLPSLGKVLIKWKMIVIVSILFIIIICSIGGVYLFQKYKLSNQVIRNPEVHYELFLIKQNGKYGYIDTAGKMVIPPQFDEAESFNEGLAAVKKGDKWGLINKKGEYVIWPQFDNSYIYFHESLAAVKKGDKWGYIDTAGKMVIPPQFDEAESFNGGLAAVRKENKWGYINKKGEVVIIPRFDEVDYDFKNALNCWLFKSRKIVIPPLLARVVINNRYGFIDRSGRIVIPPRFMETDDGFFDGYLKVKVDDKWGFIDTAGNMVIPPQFEEAKFFSEGLAAVKKGDKWGYIDKNGKNVINFQLDVDSTEEFLGGLALIETGDKWMYIDKAGKTVWEEK